MTRKGPCKTLLGCPVRVHELRRFFHSPRLHSLEVAATGVLLSFTSIFEELQSGVSTDALGSACGFRTCAVHLSHDHIWHFRSTERIPCRGQFLAVSTPGSIELHEEVCVCSLEKMERQLSHNTRKNQDQAAQDINTTKNNARQTSLRLQPRKIGRRSSAPRKSPRKQYPSKAKGQFDRGNFKTNR
jgi:hypothetical protein